MAKAAKEAEESEGNGSRRIVAALLREPRVIVLAMAILTGGGGAAYSGYSLYDGEASGRTGKGRIDRLERNAERNAEDARKSAEIDERIAIIELRVDRLELGLTVTPRLLDVYDQLSALRADIAELRGILSQD